MEMKWPFTSAARPLSCLALTGQGMLTGAGASCRALSAVCTVPPDVRNSCDAAKQRFYSLVGVVLVFLLPVSSHCWK